jgi:chloramphenicol O-acetyltransferase type A
VRYIDMQAWPRRRHFDAFRAITYPHFGLCASVDVTTFRALMHERRHSFTVAIAHLLARAANGIPEFRQRIRGEQVVEHDVVHPSMTILTPGDLFSFCTVRYAEDFCTFAAQAAEAIARVQAHPVLEDEPGQDDLLFMTSIPWVSFTSVQHPIDLGHVDSVPRIAWGRFRAVGDRLEMPLSIQVHHALMDGVHAGRYFAQVQRLLDRPQLLDPSR